MLSLRSWPGGLEDQGAHDQGLWGCVLRPRLPQAGLRPLLSVHHVKCLLPLGLLSSLPAVISLPVYP